MPQDISLNGLSNVSFVAGRLNYTINYSFNNRDWINQQVIVVGMFETKNGTKLGRVDKNIKLDESGKIDLEYTGAEVNADPLIVLYRIKNPSGTDISTVDFETFYLGAAPIDVDIIDTTETSVTIDPDVQSIINIIETQNIAIPDWFRMNIEDYLVGYIDKQMIIDGWNNLASGLNTPIPTEIEEFNDIQVAYT